MCKETDTTVKGTKQTQTGEDQLPPPEEISAKDIKQENQEKEPEPEQEPVNRSLQTTKPIINPDELRKMEEIYYSYDTSSEYYSSENETTTITSTVDTNDSGKAVHHKKRKHN